MSYYCGRCKRWHRHGDVYKRHKVFSRNPPSSKRKKQTIRKTKRKTQPKPLILIKPVKKTTRPKSKPKKQTIRKKQKIKTTPIRKQERSYKEQNYYVIAKEANHEWTNWIKLRGEKYKKMKSAKKGLQKHIDEYEDLDYEYNTGVGVQYREPLKFAVGIKKYARYEPVTKPKIVEAKRIKRKHVKI